MPRKRTTIRRRRAVGEHELNPAHVHKAFAGYAFSRHELTQEDEQRAFWQKHRNTLMRWWAEGVPSDFPSCFGFGPYEDDRQPHWMSRPAFWWMFDAPSNGPLDPDETEECYLRRHNLATEREKLAAPHMAIVRRQEALICRIWGLRVELQHRPKPWLLELVAELKTLGPVRDVRPSSRRQYMDLLEYFGPTFPNNMASAGHHQHADGRAC